jgi:hypothetical protein
MITSRRIRWAGEIRNTYKILILKLEGKRPLETPRYKWEDSIKIDHKEISLIVVDWFYLAEGRVTYKHGNIYFVSIKGEKFLH